MTKAHLQLAPAASTPSTKVSSAVSSIASSTTGSKIVVTWLCLLTGSAMAQSYGETQIGYPAMRASTTLPAAPAPAIASRTKGISQGQNQSPIPARSIVPRQVLAPKATPQRNVGSLSRGYATARPSVKEPTVARTQRTLRGKAQGTRSLSPSRSSSGKPAKSSAVYPLRHLQPDLWAGIKPMSKRARSSAQPASLRIRKRGRSAEKNRIQANLKGIAIDGMSSINYQRLIDRHIAVGAGAQHFQYQTPQGTGEEQGSGVGGELFARYKPFRNLNYHEGIFVSMGLGAMAMNWQQQIDGLGGAVTVSDQEGVYGTVSSGVSYQTAVYGSVLIEPRLDYFLFAPIESDSSKLVHRFEPTIAFGFGF